MCGKEHYGEFDGLVSVERWSGNRGVSCVVEYTIESLENCLAAVETLHGSLAAVSCTTYTM